MLILLATLLAAAPAPRIDYERKCLYCHSEEVTEARKLTDAQWKRTIERMRRKAPLLISRGDVAALAAFMTQTLKLQAPTPRAFPPKAAFRADPQHAPVARPGAPAPHPEPEPGPDLKSAPEAIALSDAEPPPVEVSPEAAEQEQQALALMRQRCTKCHTLGRVYARLDTLERSLNTLERMRLKTGSGITDHEAKQLEDYLRAQFAEPARADR